VSPKQQLRVLAALALFVVSAIAAVNATAQAAAQAPTSPHALVCPRVDTPPAAPASDKTGHHRVTLSWNAATSSANPDLNPVGYCLYRSKKQGAAKQNPECADCEQINAQPIPATTCADDLVEDDTVYYYVVTAVSATGRVSLASNETIAPVPGKEQAGPDPKGPAPTSWCRAPSVVSKQRSQP